jgi:hypothetical protein
LSNNPTSRDLTLEPANAWLFRVLGIEPDSKRRVLRIPPQRNDVILVDNNTRTAKELHPGAYKAVWSWIKFHGQGDDNRRGVAIVVSAPNASAFLMQRKDLLHPNRKLRGALCCFGGSCLKYERPETAVLRELYEEIPTPAVHKIAEALEPLSSYDYSGPEHGQDYLTTSSVAFLGWNDWDALLRQTFTTGLSEATSTVISRIEFEQVLFRQEKNSPGKTFAGRHHLFIRDAITLADKRA